jgi:hypothetical protein
VWFAIYVQTCRHFRYELPHELADELRSADAEPCPVCDAMPRRSVLPEDAFQSAKARVAVPTSAFRMRVETGWLTAFLNFMHRQSG